MKPSSRDRRQSGQQGRYAFTIQSPDKLKDFDYRISSGPVLIVPVALAYRLFGVNVWTGDWSPEVFWSWPWSCCILAPGYCWPGGLPYWR